MWNDAVVYSVAITSVSQPLPRNFGARPSDSSTQRQFDVSIRSGQKQSPFSVVLSLTTLGTVLRQQMESPMLDAECDNDDGGLARSAGLVIEQNRTKKLNAYDFR